MACNTLSRVSEIIYKFDTTSDMAVPERVPLPEDIIAIGVDGIRRIWHDKKIRARGVTEDRAKTL